MAVLSYVARSTAIALRQFLAASNKSYAAPPPNTCHLCKHPAKCLSSPLIYKGFYRPGKLA